MPGESAGVKAQSGLRSRFLALAEERQQLRVDLVFQRRAHAVRRAFRYAFRKVSRSALMVSASVVGMPCGKPL